MSSTTPSSSTNMGSLGSLGFSPKTRVLVRGLADLKERNERRRLEMGTARRRWWVPFRRDSEREMPRVPIFCGRRGIQNPPCLFPVMGRLG